jgi:hypothetical protein
MSQLADCQMVSSKFWAILWNSFLDFILSLKWMFFENLCIYHITVTLSQFWSKAGNFWEGGGGERDREIERQRCRKIQRQSDRETKRQRDKEAEKQRDRAE